MRNLQAARASQPLVARSDVDSRAADDARPTVGMAAWCLAAAGAVALANRGAIEQSTVYQNHYLGLARYFEGGRPPAEFTYPMWGYPAVLAWLPNAESISITLQVLLAVALMLALYATAARFVAYRHFARVLCVAALPVWSLASVRLADPWSMIFGAFGMLALARALGQGRVGWALVSGACFGAALNFRSDFLIVLPLFLVVLAAIAPRIAWARRRELLVAMTLAVVSLVPWGIFRVVHGAPFGLTSTNGGMVLYNALGIPGNPWGIHGDDLDREAEVRAALGPGVTPYSVEGNRFLFDRALAMMREHPEQYAQKVLHAMRASVTLGAYGIEVEPLLDDETDTLRFEVLKEQLKLRAGFAPNLHDVARFREAGVWSESLAATPLEIWLVAGLRAGNAALTGGFLLLSLMASAWIVVADRRRLARPEIAVLTAGLLAAWGAVCAISYQPRLTNLLYVLGVPLVLVALHGVRVRVRELVRDHARSRAHGERTARGARALRAPLDHFSSSRP